MSDSIRSLGEQLLQAASEVLTHRDRVLEAAKLLPPRERAQARQTAGKLQAFSAELQEIAASLPAGGEAGTEAECPPDLRLRIELALEEYEAALEEIHTLAAELDEDGEAEDGEEEEGEEEPPERVH